MNEQEQKQDSMEFEEKKQDSMDFIREKIKARPINRKKLLRRTLITLAMAIVFGVVACLTFLILEPVINNRLYPEKEPKVVSFPEESVKDELQPEDMLANEAASAASAASAANAAIAAAIAEADAAVVPTSEAINAAIAAYQYNPEDYGRMMTGLQAVSDACERSIVTVTVSTSDTDWFQDPYQKTGMTSGLIIADNNSKLFILTTASIPDSGADLRVSFYDSSSLRAELVERDPATGLCILAVPIRTMTAHVRNSAEIATLGSSKFPALTGSPVLALGSPDGTPGSVCYGFVTSDSRIIDRIDSSYQMLYTDITGSATSSGVLCNLTGQVVGIIVPDPDNENPHRILAYGITEIKQLIECMSNDQALPYLGVHGTDVPDYISTELQVPQGAYITQIEVGSPAMDAGIQSGDVIISADGNSLKDYSQLSRLLLTHRPDEKMRLTVMRQSPDGYLSMDTEITLTSRKDSYPK